MHCARRCPRSPFLPPAIRNPDQSCFLWLLPCTRWWHRPRWKRREMALPRILLPFLRAPLRFCQGNPLWRPREAPRGFSSAEGRSPRLGPSIGLAWAHFGREALRKNALTDRPTEGANYWMVGDPREGEDLPLNTSFGWKETKENPPLQNLRGFLYRGAVQLNLSVLSFRFSLQPVAKLRGG